MVNSSQSSAYNVGHEDKEEITIISNVSHQVGNDTRCATIAPQSGDFLRHVSMTEKIFFFLCLAATLFVMMEYLSKMKFVFTSYNTPRSIKWKTVQILGVYPAVAIPSVFSLFVPRADLLCELSVTVYLARSMVNFVNLMDLYFGGMKKLNERLEDHRVNYRQAPCCCCCFCLPTSPVNRKSLIAIKVLVLQGAFILPLATTATVFMWIDGRYHRGSYDANNAFPYLQILTAISTLVTIWGFQIYYDLCREELRSLLIVPKFAALKLVIVLTRLQRLIFNILAANGLPSCDEVVSSIDWGMTYHHIIVILEVALLTLLARKFYLQPLTVHEGKLSVKKNVDGAEKGESLEKKLTDGDNAKQKMLIENGRDSVVIEDPTRLAQLKDCRESDI